MKKYIVIYYAPTTVIERIARATPEEAQEGVKLWFAWKEKLGPSLIDIGTPIGNAMKVTKKGTTKSDSQVIGYSILQASSMDEALEMVKDHHHLQWAGSCELEVYEQMPIPELETV
jgi:hypothetical protein